MAGRVTGSVVALDRKTGPVYYLMVRERTGRRPRASIRSRSASYQ